MSVVWGNDTVLSLLEHYKRRVVLWETSNRDYRNKIKKNDAWEDIAKALELPRKEIETKVHTLRSQFVRERKKVKSKNSKNTGSGRPDVKSSAWFAYDAMTFLLKDTNDDRIEATEHADDSDPENIHMEFHEDDSEPVAEAAEVDQKPVNPLLESPAASPPREPRQPARPVLKARRMSKFTNKPANGSARREETERRRLQQRPTLNAFQLQQAMKQMEQAVDGLRDATRLQPQEDDCDDFGKLIAKKLRRLTDERKDFLMVKIGQIIYNECHTNDPNGSDDE